MQIIKIFIQSQIAGPRKATAKYGYVIESRAAGGNRTLVEIGCLKDASANRLTAAAAARALARTRHGDQITIVTDNAQMKAAIEKGWLLSWEAAGWKNSKGKPVANADIWKLISAGMQGKEIRIDLQEGNEYKEWLFREMEKVEILPGHSRIILPE